MDRVLSESGQGPGGLREPVEQREDRRVFGDLDAADIVTDAQVIEER